MPAESPSDGLSPMTDEPDLLAEKAPPKSGQRTRTAPISRASVACVSCRDRKIKCHGGSGQTGTKCARCRRLGTVCVFRLDDLRKRPKGKVLVQRLKDRVAELEEMFHQKTSKLSGGASPPDTVNGAINTGSRERSGDSTSESGQHQTGDSHPQSQSIHMEPESFADVTYDGQLMGDGFDFFEPSNLDRAFAVNELEHCTEGRTRSIDARLHLIDRMSVAMGQLSPDEFGPLCCCGSTSNLQITSLLPPSQPTASTESASRELESFADSDAVRTHLIQLYFTHQDPLLQFLQKETFMADYTKGMKTQYYSDFLLYSVLLSAIRLSDSPLIRKVDKVYFPRANGLLAVELENPTVSTIQAMCIFGDYRTTQEGDQACWLYPAIAFRILEDLGLNRDCTDLMEMGYLSERDLESRHITYWSIHVYDKLYSIYRGRLSSVRAADATVPRISYEHDDPQFQTLAAWSNISTILTDIIDGINGQQHQLTVFRLSETGERLLRWRKSLPDELRWNSKQGILPAPGVCALHMQFYTAVILLHRPFASDKLSPPNAEPTSALSKQTCNENAFRISKLVQLYREQYGVQKVFHSMLYMVFTAATTFISQMASDMENGQADKEKAELLVCLKVFEDLTSTFQIAARAHKVLTSLLRYLEPVPFVETDFSSCIVHLYNGVQQPHEQGITGDQSIGSFPIKSAEGYASQCEIIPDNTIPNLLFDFSNSVSSPFPHPFSYLDSESQDQNGNRKAYHNLSGFNELDYSGIFSTSDLDVIS